MNTVQQNDRPEAPDTSDPPRDAPRSLWARLGRDRLAREGAWAVTGQVAAAIGVLVGTRLLTEFVDKPTYGLANLLLGIAAFGKNVFVGPLFQAILRLHPDMARTDDLARLRRTASRMITWATTGLIALVLVGGFIYSAGFEPLWLSIVLLAVLIGVEIPQRLEITILSAERRQRAIAVLSALNSIVRPGLVVLVVLLWSASVDAMMLGHLIGAAFILWATIWALRHNPTATASAAPPSEPLPDTDRQLMHDIWRYAAPLVIVALLGWVTGLSDRYVIGALLDLDAVGLYAAMYGLISFPFLIAQGVIELTLRPVYFDAVARGDERTERRMYALWIWLSAIVAGLGFVLIWLLQDWIALLLLAEEYRASARLMPWIAAGYAFVMMSYAAEKACFARKRTSWILWVQVVATIVCVVAEVVMTRTLGLRGAAMAVPVYFGVQAALTLVAAQKARQLDRGRPRETAPGGHLAPAPDTAQPGVDQPPPTSV